METARLLRRQRSPTIKRETASESLSFPCQTGNPAADILLGEKLRLAKEIAVEVSLRLPSPCPAPAELTILICA
jgi:hypothetical protein